MPTWSTDVLPAADRFDYWREVRAKNLFGVSIELDPAKRGSFRGKFSAEPLAAATLIEMHASPYAVARTNEDISRHPTDSLCIYQQTRGAAWFSTAKKAEFTVVAGAIATSHSDLPYATRPLTDEGFHLRILKMPFTICAPLTRREADLFPQPLDRDQRLKTLLSLYFTALLDQAPELDDADTADAVATMALLILAVRGVVANYDEPVRGGIRQARLMCARDMVARNFHRSDLSPAVIARMLGISVRHLHLLFEPTGMSFARYLALKRLAHARELLAQTSERPVSSIAFASGFESLATFYRSFRNTVGVSPMDYRQAVRSGY